MSRAEQFKNIVAEIDQGKNENWSDFIEYAYDICRHEPDKYQTEIIDQYPFNNQACNEAVEWIKRLMDSHIFSRNLITECIATGKLGDIQWCWKYVHGMGDGIPIDCTIISFEAPDSLHIWAEYGEQEEFQPIGPFAKLEYDSLHFQLSQHTGRFIIFTLSGMDSISQQNIYIELRVYTRKCKDEEGDVYYDDEEALKMANRYWQMLDTLKYRYRSEPELLSDDEIDALLHVVDPPEEDPEQQTQ